VLDRMGTLPFILVSVPVNHLA
jgi:hypothetical protein